MIICFLLWFIFLGSISISAEGSLISETAKLKNQAKKIEPYMYEEPALILKRQKEKLYNYWFQFAGTSPTTPGKRHKNMKKKRTIGILKRSSALFLPVDSSGSNTHILKNAYNVVANDQAQFETQTNTINVKALTEATVYNIETIKSEVYSREQDTFDIALLGVQKSPTRLVPSSKLEKTIMLKSLTATPAYVDDIESFENNNLSTKLNLYRLAGQPITEHNTYADYIPVNYDMPFINTDTTMKEVDIDKQEYEDIKRSVKRLNMRTLWKPTTKEGATKIPSNDLDFIYSIKTTKEALFVVNLKKNATTTQDTVNNRIPRRSMPDNRTFWKPISTETLDTPLQTPVPVNFDLNRYLDYASNDTSMRFNLADTNYSAPMDANYTAQRRWLFFSGDTISGNCYSCGLKQTGVPPRGKCHDIFSKNPDTSFKYQRTRYRISCNSNAGCFKRWVDIGNVYDERGCRTTPPTIGWSHASKKLSKLEEMLQNRDDECVYSPHASLTPFSRTVSLYARYHACVCLGSYCNKTNMKAVDWVVLCVCSIFVGVYNVLYTSLRLRDYD